MKEITKHFTPQYRLPVLLLCVPLLMLMVLYVLGWALHFLSGPPPREIGLMDSLPTSATPFQQFAHDLGWFVVILLALTWYFVLPACLILGISILLFRVFKKDKTRG